MAYLGTAERHCDPHKLRLLLDYTPETGELVWKTRTTDWFNGEPAKLDEIARLWNAAYAGKRALANTCGNGYAHGTVLGYIAKAHRVIWALMTGAWPIDQIDHVNGIRSDNRWSNLRQVTNRINSQNSAMRKDNTSGFSGVRFDQRRNKWQARIVKDGRERHLGYFDDIASAAAARERAKLALGFTERHGLPISEEIPGVGLVLQDSDAVTSSSEGGDRACPKDIGPVATDHVSFHNEGSNQ